MCNLGKRAFPSKLGYYNAFLDRISRLAKVYDVDKKKVLEVSYLASLSNGQGRFYEVTTEMLIEEDMKRQCLEVKRGYRESIY